MELHQRQQFDFLLLTAAERFTERLIQRNGGMASALKQLRESPEGQGVWLRKFVEALFRDFLLDNPEGACFILQALPKREVSLEQPGGKVETLLQEMAIQAFMQVLHQKVEEHLDQALAFSGETL